MDNCIFCKIIKGDIPADVVNENDDFLAFRDINAIAPTHILCIPKTHIKDFLEFDSESMKDMSDFIKQTVVKLNFKDDSFRLISNTKELSGQSVFHLHFHILGGGELKWESLS